MAGAGETGEPHGSPHTGLLRSSPTWNGRCWRDVARRATLPTVVAILTDLEWPVLAGNPPRGTPATRRCDPHRLGMAGAGGRARELAELDRRCDAHRLGMDGAGPARQRR